MLTNEEKTFLEEVIKNLPRSRILSCKTLAKAIENELSEKSIPHNSDVHIFTSKKFKEIYGDYFPRYRHKSIKKFILENYHRLDDRQLAYQLNITTGTVSHIRKSLGLTRSGRITEKRTLTEKYLRLKIRLMKSSYLIHYKVLRIGRITHYNRTKINEITFYGRRNVPYLVVSIVPEFWYLDEYQLLKEEIYGVDVKKILSSETDYFYNRILDINLEFSRIIDRVLCNKHIERSIKNV